MLGDLGALGDALRLAHRYDERSMTFGAKLGIDRGDDDVYVGDPAIGRPCLLAIDDPLARRLVELGAGTHSRDVRARVRLGGTEGSYFDLIDGAEAPRDPLADLLARALAEDRCHRQRSAHDRHADAGVAPKQLLVDDR